jgi:mono/diheme cytochrome c family protein
VIIAALWKNDLRHYLIAINFVAFAVLIGYLVRSVLSPRRARAEGAVTPANQTPFLDDDDLESRRLERVQGWGLVFAAVVAISLPFYWLREPTRQDQSATYFDENSVERGATLFASPGMEAYDAAASQQCANCHGENGEGGAAPFRLGGEEVSWKAPPLNTELLRFREDASCAKPREQRPADAVCEVTNIITFGRPGTPMQPFGVAGGGPLNEQSVADLVAYIRSIQLGPEEAQRQAAAELAAARGAEGPCPAYTSCPDPAVESARGKVDSADKALGDKRTAVREALASPNATDAELTTRCEQLRDELPTDPDAVDETQRTQARACGEFLDAAEAAADARAGLDWALEWQRRRANVSDGQILFELYCARCHTQGWSVFDPTKPPLGVTGANLDSVTVLGLAGGGGGTGGGIGFNLRDGATLRRFGTDEDGGFDRHVAFVAQGSLPNQPYGNGGIGSGRMPGFASMLTPEQIRQIVRYERDCLDATTYTDVSPVCETPPRARTPATTTTTTAPEG